MAGLHPTLRAIARNLPRVAAANGFQARVTSGYRSRAKQTYLYNRWKAGLQPYPVAVPGTSDHETGLALDVISTDTTKLVRLLTSVGLGWAGPTDPVHFYIGARKSQATAKSSIGQSWEQGPGKGIPGWASYIPGGLGTIAQVMTNPIQAKKSALSRLLDVALSAIGI